MTETTRSSLESVNASPSDIITQNHLRCVFNPRGVAVVGATERLGSVGRTVLENLMKGTQPLPFTIFPVNPNRQTVLGLQCFPSVSAIPGDTCEHAVIITPAAKCVDVVRDCAAKKSVRVVVVLAAGFKEVGEEGLKLENELVRVAAEANIAVVGPNCLGVMCPPWRMNATFAADAAAVGHVAFISQSGAMCTAVLDWALNVNLGFSAFVSIGSMSHVEFAHCVEFLGNDDHTKALILYMESIGNARNFLAAARQVSAKKPVVVIKAGKTAAAAAAAVSHTGSLAGSHDAFVAAMECAGCLVVNSIDELQNLALLSATQPRPDNEKLIIITNAGGPGVLSTDAAAVAGLEITELSTVLVDHLSTFLPAAWSHSNPVDVLGDAKAVTYAKSVEAVFEKGPNASILVVLSPQSVTEPEATARAVGDAVQKERKRVGSKCGPVACAWMGGNMVSSGRRILVEEYGVPCFAQPDIAAQALALFAKSVSQARQIAPTVHRGSAAGKCKAEAQAVIAKAAMEQRTILTESESKSVMKAYGIPVAESVICQTAEEAAQAAEKMKYPCVLKLNSETITHKSDVGGVKLNLLTGDAVRTAFSEIKANVEKIGSQHFQGVSVQPMLDISAGVELLVGSSADAQFGPMCLFGTGGCFVEVFRDVAMAVPPLSRDEAEKFVAKTKISKALQKDEHGGQRFKGCPMEEVYDILQKFSHLICDLHELVPECEINPLLALPDRVIALDARVVLRSPDQGALAVPCQLGA